MDLPVDVSKLVYEGIANDGSYRSMSILLSAKELYKGELLEMPEEYIAALVFDSYHETLAVLDGEETPELLGGITFRCFRELGFVEVAFVAVRKDRASRGVGGAMMAHFKEWMRRRQVYHILACADLKAVGFFRKLGFNEDIVLPRSAYQGFIKEYRRVLLMESVLTDSIPFLHTRSTLHEQLDALVRIVAARCSDSRVVTPTGRQPIGYVPPTGSASLIAAAKVDLGLTGRLVALYASLIARIETAHPAARLDFAQIRERLALPPERPFYVTPFIFAADCRSAFRAAREAVGAAREVVNATNAAEKDFLRELGGIYRIWLREGPRGAVEKPAAK